MERSNSSALKSNVKGAQNQKHTPGPWTVQLTGRRGSFHIPEAAKHEAENSEDGVDGYTVSKANANLIASAPELLEIAQAIVDNPAEDLLARAEAAVAKAEGR